MHPKVGWITGISQPTATCYPLPFGQPHCRCYAEHRMYVPFYPSAAPTPLAQAALDEAGTLRQQLKDSEAACTAAQQEKAALIQQLAAMPTGFSRCWLGRGIGTGRSAQGSH